MSDDDISEIRATLNALYDLEVHREKQRLQQEEEEWYRQEHLARQKRRQRWIEKMRPRARAYSDARSALYLLEKERWDEALSKARSVGDNALAEAVSAVARYRSAGRQPGRASRVHIRSSTATACKLLIKRELGVAPCEWDGTEKNPLASNTASLDQEFGVVEVLFLPDPGEIPFTDLVDLDLVVSAAAAIARRFCDGKEGAERRSAESRVARFVPRLLKFVQRSTEDRLTEALLAHTEKGNSLESYPIEDPSGHIAFSRAWTRHGPKTTTPVEVFCLFLRTNEQGPKAAVDELRRRIDLLYNSGDEERLTRGVVDTTRRLKEEAHHLAREVTLVRDELVHFCDEVTLLVGGDFMSGAGQSLYEQCIERRLRYLNRKQRELSTDRAKKWAALGAVGGMLLGVIAETTGVPDIVGSYPTAVVVLVSAALCAAGAVFLSNATWPTVSTALSTPSRLPTNVATPPK